VLALQGRGPLKDTLSQSEQDGDILLARVPVDDKISEKREPVARPPATRRETRRQGD
jgi:hypothetical protein